MKGETYARIILEYLQREGIRIFTPRYIKDDLGLTIGQLGTGIRFLKKMGVIEKYNSIAWKVVGCRS